MDKIDNDDKYTPNHYSNIYSIHRISFFVHFLGLWQDKKEASTSTNYTVSTLNCNNFPWIYW